MSGPREPTTAGGIQAERWTLDLLDEAATMRLARDLAHFIRPGDLVALSGELGAGKTTLARAVIRRLAGDQTLEVPSPTFTLLQAYETPRGTVVHADLFRLGSVAELDELGWEEAGEGAAVLVEWPERAGDALPPDRLDVILEHQPDTDPNFRRASLVGHGSIAARLARLREGRAFLDAADWGEANRLPIKGDASTRSYERLAKAGQTAILMDSPRRADGPPLRGGRAYSAVARLAEDVAPFVAIGEGLRGLGLSAPQVYAADLDRGFLLLEDLGSVPVVIDGNPVPERYERAVDVLAHLHETELPSELPVGAGLYRIPRYDREAMLAEVELFVDWYLPALAGRRLGDAEKHRFLALWSPRIEEVLAGASTWSLRDYHSPNFIWMEDRAGLEAVGLLDYQDAVLGPVAYDLVSLLQDARVTVPEHLEIALLRRYLETRGRTRPDLDLQDFLRSYAILGAQRATKILGIFARLARRDHKPAYLDHVPRIRRYLERDLAHPALAEMAAFVAEMGFLERDSG